MNYEEFLAETKILKEEHLPVNERIVNWRDVAKAIGKSANMVNLYVNGRVQKPKEDVMLSILMSAGSQFDNVRCRATSVAQKSKYVAA